jgi:hypothetical protein
MTVTLSAWIPSDFALLTWSLEKYLAKPIENELGADYKVLIDDSPYTLTNTINGQVHTYELTIVEFPELNDLPKAKVFLYIKDSEFDKQFKDISLDKILIQNEGIYAKIGCIGSNEEIVNKIKNVILNMNFNNYKAYEL